MAHFCKLCHRNSTLLFGLSISHSLSRTSDLSLYCIEMLTGCPLKRVPSCCKSLLELCLFNRCFSLSAFEILLRTFFFAHPLPVLARPLLLLLLLQFIFVGKSELREAQFEIGIRDPGVDDLSEYIDPLERLLDSLNHAGHIIPVNSCNRSIAFAVECSKHDLDLLIMRLPSAALLLTVQLVG